MTVIETVETKEIQVYRGVDLMNTNANAYTRIINPGGATAQFQINTSAATMAKCDDSFNWALGSGTTVTNCVLALTSTTKAFLPPRMTTAQKNAIGTPIAGMIVYDSSLNKLCVYTGAAWETITSA